jgi:hypothetical protein
MGESRYCAWQILIEQRKIPTGTLKMRSVKCKMYGLHVWQIIYYIYFSSFWSRECAHYSNFLFYHVSSFCGISVFHTLGRGGEGRAVSVLRNMPLTGYATDNIQNEKYNAHTTCLVYIFFSIDGSEARKTCYILSVKHANHTFCTWQNAFSRSRWIFSFDLRECVHFLFNLLVWYLINPNFCCCQFNIINKQQNNSGRPSMGLSINICHAQ